MKNYQEVSVQSLTTGQKRMSVLIIAIMFFVFGFVTWINAILIPYFKLAFELNHFESYLVAFAFYIAYLVMSLPAGYLLNRFGFKTGMMWGFFVMSVGAFLFIPAGAVRSYPLFLLGLFTLGIGLSVLQTAANPYVTILGDKERAAQRFSIMGICNKMAGIIAPLLFAAIILKPEDKEYFESILTLSPQEKNLALNGLTQRVMVPYGIVGVVFIGLGFLIKFSPLPEINTSVDGESDLSDAKAKPNILAFPHLVLGSVAIFFHVGSQVIAVDSIINYAQHHGLSFYDAKTFPSYTLTATIIGYLLGIFLIPKYISQLSALKFCTCFGLILSTGILFFNGEINLLGYHTDVSVWFLVLLGFANSMIWAGVWPLALSDLGKYLKIGASLLVMALCGNAILPMLYGYFADYMGLREAYWVLIPCYAYLIYYAFHGYKLRNWKT